MQNLKTKLPLLVLVATLFIGCCDSTDYSKTIKKVAEPMLKELDVFYKKNKRHPTVKERDVMLKKVGCKMDGDECLYDGDKILVDTYSYDGEYTFGMTLEKTYCNFALQKNKKFTSVRCYNNPCIKLGQ